MSVNVNLNVNVYVYVYVDIDVEKNFNKREIVNKISYLLSLDASL